MTRVEAGVLALIAVVMWSALLWGAACYGAGWCRWAGPAYTDQYGHTVHEKGSGGQMFDFRIGGWGE